MEVWFLLLREIQINFNIKVSDKSYMCQMTLSRFCKLCRCRYVSLILISSISGFGTLLMEEAERIAREEHGAVKIAVISGVGTRDYYRKLGYSLDGPYMSKPIVQ